MNILIVANEFPYPANHGGKVDILNRIIAFKNAGHKIFLITWQGIKKDKIPNENEINYVEQYLEKLIVLNILRNIKRIVNLVHYPSLVSARIIDNKKYNDILNEARIFSPDFIFVDGLYGAKIGNKLKNNLKIPLGIRLHNIEWTYMRGQYGLTNGIKNKLSLLAACFHLKSFEKWAISESDVFFDISIDDLKYWTEKGFKQGHWLPTIIFPKVYSEFKSISYNFDIGFLGNLNTPNNVDGIKWFITKVYPLLLEKLPKLKFLLIGSDPSLEILYLCKRYDSITLIENPENPFKYLNQANVLINPVRFGSGVNIKSIEMLMLENEVVCTTVGKKGMPEEISKIFFIADTPEQFSESISNILQNNFSKNINQKNKLRDLYNEESIEIVIKSMQEIIQKKIANF